MYNALKALVSVAFTFVTFWASVIVAGLFNGLVLSVLWKWFVAPVFHLANITIFQAWGLAVLFHYLTVKPDMTTKVVDADGKVRNKTLTESLITNLWTVAFTGGVALLVGWILNHFV